MKPTPWTWNTVWIHFEAHPLYWGLSLLLFISPLIIHEMGHWVWLKKCHIPVEEIGLGFGPRLFRIGIFGVRPLLIGAYVLPEQKAFKKASPLTQLQVAAAGPVANFLYAALLLFIVASHQSATGIQGLLGIAALSFTLGVLNSIPFPPLDGWVIFESTLVLLGFTPGPKWKRTTQKAGSALLYGLGALLLLWLLHPGPILSGFF